LESPIGRGKVYIFRLAAYIPRATMGVFIKNPATEAKIRELAARTGETLTEAVDHSVDERLGRLGPTKGKGRVDRKRLAELLAYFDSLPNINESLTDDEIIGYDKNGLPK
jgi:antitoxin VapB